MAGYDVCLTGDDAGVVYIPAAACRVKEGCLVFEGHTGDVVCVMSPGYWLYTQVQPTPHPDRVTGIKKGR